MRLNFLLAAILLGICSGSAFTQKILNVKGKVVQIGSTPSTTSGARRLSFQLVKYEVVADSKDFKKGAFLVVDYVIFSFDQLSKLRVGDVATLHLSEEEKLSPIVYEEGIRSVKEDVHKFYILRSHKVKGRQKKK